MGSGEEAVAKLRSTISPRLSAVAQNVEAPGGGLLVHLEQVRQIVGQERQDLIGAQDSFYPTATPNTMEQRARCVR